MRRKALTNVLFAGLLVLGAAACGSNGDDSHPDGGTSQTDGGGDASECTTDADCDDGNLCDGTEQCLGGTCRDGASAADGTTCTIDGASGEFFCTDGLCQASRCGDGYVAAGEICDDGNTTSGDGCEADCTFSCEADADCDDSNICNGTESCNVTTHACLAGVNEANGTECGAGRDCQDGRCIVYGCGDGNLNAGEECDDGNNDSGDGCEPDCTFTCHVDADCNDSDVCNGEESCDTVDHVCTPGTALACDDSNACTDDQCDPEFGCQHPLIDADADGHAASSLGSCGDDCDDNDDAIYDGAPELCDGKDNDCNGQTDELAPNWYVDCDGDGFAPDGAQQVQQCSEPPPPTTVCAAGSASAWTGTAPSASAGTVDCWDRDAAAHPYTASTDYQAYHESAIAGRPTSVDFDYNCDGTEEKRPASVNVSTRATCSGTIVKCSGAAGWAGSAPPACGASGTYSFCYYNSTARMCVRRIVSQVQACR